MLSRVYDNLEEYLKPGKVLIIYGPRQAGKTTLLNNFLSKTSYKYKLDSGDNIRTQQILSSSDFEQILSYVEGYQLLVIDEAQNIPEIGRALKIIVDQMRNLRVIVTGSSSFKLSHSAGEPLTGRKKTLVLYPISHTELAKDKSQFELKSQLEDFLIYGMYPEVLTTKNKTEKVELLNELVNSYLLKDILTLFNLKKPALILDLLKLLAFQIGSQVSINELATNLRVDFKTIVSYLDILEQAFVIKKIGSYSRNLRNELTKSAKYYFLDLGIRNGIINHFNKLKDRDDIGKLWENFLYIERVKFLNYKRKYKSIYFWRTYSGGEIDFIEEHNGKTEAYEAKWKSNKILKAPPEWKRAYPKAKYKVIDLNNYLDFIL